MGAAGAGPAFADLCEEIVALVVHQNEGGEVLHLNLPDGFHAQFRVFQQFHLPDVILGQDGGGTADGTQVKAAVLLAGVRHLLAAVALGDHDHGAAVFLEQVHVGIHAPRGGGAEGAGGIPFRGLGRTRVVHGMVLHVLGHAFTLFQAFLQLGVGDVARHDDGAVQAQARGDGVLAQFRQHFLHRAVQVNGDGLAGGHAQRFRNVLSGIGFQLFNEVITL